MAEKMKVYIWDMDETLILLRSLLNGTYASAFNGLKNVKHGEEIGKLWESYILEVCDKSFFYEQIENCNQPYLDILSNHDDGLDLSDYNFSQDGFGAPVDDVLQKRKLAYRYRIIAERYQKGLHSILHENVIKLWDRLYDLTDTYTDRWLSSARACLEQCAGHESDTNLSPNSVTARNGDIQHVNVLVTSGPLIPSLIKCLFYRFDKLISHDNVYSSLEVGKPKCFSWIKERFEGPDVQFCVIGDSWEECEAAESMKWPFVKIDMHPNSIHRFPGLNPVDLSHYLSVVYGLTDEDIKSNGS